MNDVIKELSLLLLYLTSWEEDAVIAKVRRSWKGYPFEILDDLTEEEFISDSRRSKSVYLTEKGIKKAQETAKKYQIEDDNI